MTQGVISGQSEGTVEVTPSGIAIYFQSKPKRVYKLASKRLIGSNHFATAIEIADPAEWREVPSVTTVLGVLDKPALPWWGMKVGVEGVCELVNRYSLFPYQDEVAGQVLGVPFHRGEISGLRVATLDDCIERLTEHKLTVNHVRDKAGDRGQAVHDAFEAWARTGLKPDPAIYPDEERGYVEGLLAFLADVPTIEPLACEVLVASVEHGYAGRYDIRFRTSEPHKVVVHRTPKKGPQIRVLAPGVYLGDLKTSKGIYASHARQLEAYEQASIESGYEPTEARGILKVSADGTYEFVRSWATFEDFLCVLRVWQSDQEMKERK